MKKGDKVVIKDNSYSKVVVGNGLESGYGGLHSVRKNQGTIIEVGCRFPDPHEYQTQCHTRNDTVVITDSGKVVFIEERFLCPVPPKHKVMIDMVTYPTCGGHGVVGGQVVEISDKLYKEIQRDSQS